MRTNEEWLRDLRGSSERTEAALRDLRDYLLRAVVIYLRRHRTDLAQYNLEEVQELAEDSAQKAQIAILQKLNTFRGESKFTSWAYRFVINIAASELRLRRWSTVSLDALRGDEENVSLLALLEDQTIPDPELSAQRQQVLVILQQIIERDLTERQRLAIIGVHFQGLPIEEVAESLETNRNNVYKLIYDARKRIRQQLLASHLTENDILSIFGDES